MKNYEFPEMVLDYQGPHRAHTRRSANAGVYTKALVDAGEHLDVYQASDVGLSGLEDSVMSAASSLLGGANAQLAEFRQAMTITTAASVAAALAGAFLLFRTSR
jgi:hypothetical protein